MIPLHWHTEPTLLVSLLFFGWIYALFTGPLRNKIAADTVWPKRRVLLFLTGLLATYLTVGSPLDQLGEDFLFSAHMVQHILLIYLLPCLFYFGFPYWLLDALLNSDRNIKVIKILVNPVFAGFAFTITFTLWHLPALYVAALKSKAIHIFEHCTLFGTAILMWWSIISPSKAIPPHSYPVRMLYIFLLMVGQLPVFGYLTFSGEVLYSTYAFAPRLAFFNLTPLEDQIYGGVIMKITNMVVSLTVFGTSFYLWAKSSRDQIATKERKDPSAAKPQPN